jgi:hypothetical protein
MISIVEERLKTLNLGTQLQEESALKQIMQEIILNALSEVDFFNIGIFQGGTSLRILYGLPRFSEDLDFILKEPDPDFRWKPFINAIVHKCIMYGIDPEIIEKSKIDHPVKKMVLKDKSIINQLNLTFPHSRSGKKLKIKLEVDTDSPEGSGTERRFCDFPQDYIVVVQDLPSNFAGKCHALLCRNYVKGRDWFDFSWYVARKIVPNFSYLSSAINKAGPWEGKKLKVTHESFLKKMKERIQEISWDEAKADVERFIDPEARKSLKLWGSELFLDKLEKLDRLISEGD